MTSPRPLPFKNGSRGILYCEVGSTPLVMSTMDEGSYKVEGDVMHVETAAFILKIPASIGETREAQGKLTHRSGASHEVKVVFEVDRP